MRHGGAVGLGTTLQATRSRVRFSIGSMRFFVELKLSPQYGPGIDSESNRNVCQEYFLGVKVAGAWAENHTRIHMPTFYKLWKPQPPRAL
jgi:hypothetical protein